MRVLIPTYFDPDSDAKQWKKLLSAKVKPWAVILNPENGPGRQLSQTYVTLCNTLRQAGISIFGYVHTSEAQRNKADVVKDIALWNHWYEVKNIFLDEASTSINDVGYYQELHEQVRGPLILNHGTVPPDAYLGVGDILVIFEDNYQTHKSVQFPAYVNKSKRFAQIIHSTPQSKIQAVLKKVSETSEFVFVTDRKMPNPYAKLPSYSYEV